MAQIRSKPEPKRRKELVLICSKYKPKNKRNMAQTNSKPEPKKGKRLVLTCWKLEPGKEEENSSKKIKIKAERKNGGCL